MRRGESALPDAAATRAMGAALADVVRAGDVVALSGPLGAGKTSLVRGLIGGLGFAGDAPSPTFPIVIAYDPPEVRVPLWHVDLYRISDPADLAELGLEDARESAAMAIEWPERMGDRLWGEALRLDLGHDGVGRRLTWSAPAAWDGRWPPPRR